MINLKFEALKLILTQIVSDIRKFAITFRSI